MIRKCRLSMGLLYLHCVCGIDPLLFFYSIHGTTILMYSRYGQADYQCTSGELEPAPIFPVYYCVIMTTWGGFRYQAPVPCRKCMHATAQEAEGSLSWLCPCEPHAASPQLRCHAIFCVFVRVTEVLVGVEATATALLQIAMMALGGVRSRRKTARPRCKKLRSRRHQSQPSSAARCVLTSACRGPRVQSPRSHFFLYP